MTRTYADGLEDAARQAAVTMGCATHLDRGLILDVQADIRALSTSPSGIEDAREGEHDDVPYDERVDYEERILAAEMDAIAARRDLNEARELARADKDRRIEIALKMLVTRWPVANQLSIEGQTAIVNAMEDFAQALSLPAPPLCESASSKIGGDHG